MKLKSTKKSIHVCERYTVDNSHLIVIKNYVDNKLESVGLEGKGPHGSYPVVVKPSFKDYIKTKNPFQDYKENTEHIVDSGRAALNDIDIDKAWKDGLIYFFYNAGHVLFDHKGDPVPLPHTYDYIGTNFSSRKSDLEKLQSALLKHKWVINKDDLKMHQIPYYNGGGMYLPVRILPDSKTYKQMYEMALTSRKEYFSVELKELVIGNSYKYKDWDPLKIHKYRKKEEDATSNEDDD